jgi:hypothetical protein
MQKIAFVMPVYKENPSALQDAFVTIRGFYPEALIIVVADDKESAVVARDDGAVVPFHSTKIGFGKSLIEGLGLAWFTYNCDLVATIDIDHPISALKDFIAKINEGYDICVGHERGAWKKSRIWSNQIVRKLLLDDVYNPTCGYTLWTKEALSKVPWENITANWDMVHPELLYWAKHSGSKLTDCEFDEVQKVRYYAKKRYFSWAGSLISLWFRKQVMS